jgi:hypothetical protein
VVRCIEYNEKSASTGIKLAYMDAILKIPYKDIDKMKLEQQMKPCQLQVISDKSI